MKRLHSAACLLTLAAAAASLQCGCASPAAKGESTSKGLTAMTTTIANGDKALDAVILALNNLSNGTTDLKKRFDSYDSAVDDLADSARSIRGEAESIRADGEAYFKWWEQQVAKIHNEDLKNANAARRQSLRDQFNGISGSITAAKAQFGPFMSDLREIQTVLGTSLTPAMVASIKPTMDRTIVEGGAVRETLTTLTNQYRALGLEMSAGTAKK